jgi:3-hydroxybutyrate dehydrogenase
MVNEKKKIKGAQVKKTKTSAPKRKAVAADLKKATITLPTRKGSMDGKVVLVTGSTSGIGLAIAKAFAAEGANIVLNGFGDQRYIDSLRDELELKYSVKVHYNGADMTKPAEIAAMIADIEKRLKRLDCLVNNVRLYSSTKSFCSFVYSLTLQVHILCTMPNFRPEYSTCHLLKPFLLRSGMR